MSGDTLEVCSSIEFFRSPADGGDQSLHRTCIEYAKIPQVRPMIFVFDRDNPPLLKEISDGSAPFKAWGNNVFSFAIPVPAFRPPASPVSVELLYTDADLKREDPAGRRLFLSAEFDGKSGNLLAGGALHVGNVNRVRGGSGIRIVDGDVGVYDRANRNVALSKAQFAELVAARTPPFHDVNFEGFRGVLETIKNITRSAAAESNSQAAIQGSSTEDVPPLHPATSTPYDNPPHVPIFVGRVPELRSLDNPQLRVAAITGLGGEGKSTLAAKFFTLAFRSETASRFERCGWVDCKEVGSSFHERLLLLVDELTTGEQPRAKYADENIGSTIFRFIQALHRRESLVVFDNVDAFVDKEASVFTGVVRQLFEAVTTKLSRGLVIFTCRPAINDHHPSFLEIPVGGLSEEETAQLVKDLSLNIRKELLTEIWANTSGHALWLNLIFGQVRSGRIPLDAVKRMLGSPTSVVYGLTSGVIQSVWKNLSSREREVLAVISAFTRPQAVERIQRASDLSYQRTARIIRALASMRMVVEVDVDGRPHYELHPIIRAKARLEAPAKRKNLIDRVMAVILPAGIPGLGELVRMPNGPRGGVEAFIESAEVAIENRASVRAIERLNELAKYLWRIGEEPKFIDLAKRLLDSLETDGPKVGIDPLLTEVFSAFVEALLQQDDAPTADRYLSRFEASLESISQLITATTIRGYFLWYQNRHTEAVELMATRMAHIRGKGEEIPEDLRYNYGLALRDSGRIDEAVEIFRKGRDWSVLEAWSSTAAEDWSADIGNLGRCFYLHGDYAHADVFLNRSAEALGRARESRTDRVNHGYALLWLADLKVARGNLEAAASALQEVTSVWREYAPARLAKILKHIESYPVTVKDFPQIQRLRSDIAT